MVLDGAIDPSLTWDRLLAGQARGFEVALNAFLDDCQKTGCEFRKAVKGDLFDAFDDDRQGVESKPLPGDGSPHRRAGRVLARRRGRPLQPRERLAGRSRRRWPPRPTARATCCSP